MIEKTRGKMVEWRTESRQGRGNQSRDGREEIRVGMRGESRVRKEEEFRVEIGGDWF